MTRSTEVPVMMKLLELSAVPVGVVTLICPELALVGTVAVIWVAESTVKVVLKPLKVTVWAEVKFEPVMTTLAFAPPLVGEKLLMTGGGLVWPSTLLRKAVAMEGERAAKKVKPVSTSIALAEVM